MVVSFIGWPLAAYGWNVNVPVKIWQWNASESSFQPLPQRSENLTNPTSSSKKNGECSSEMNSLKPYIIITNRPGMTNEGIRLNIHFILHYFNWRL